MRGDILAARRRIGDSHGLAMHQARYGLPAFVIAAPAVLRLTVVRQRTVRHRDRQRRRRDLQLAVLYGQIVVNIKGKVAGIDGKAGSRQIHGICIDIGTLGFRRLTAGQGYADAVRRGRGPFAVGNLVFNGIVGDRLLGSVVGLAVRIAGDLHLQDRLPHGVEVVIGMVFVSRDRVGYLRLIGIAIVSTSIIIIPQEVRRSRIVGMRGFRRTGIQLVPTDELVSRALGGRGDGDRLVDGQRVSAAAILNAIPADIILVVAVAEPEDEGRCRFFLVNIFRNDADRVSGRLNLGVRRIRRGGAGLGVAHIKDVVFIFRIDPLGHEGLGVGLQNFEFLSGIFIAVINPFRAIPLLDDPLGENLSLRRVTRRACRDGGARILVGQRILRRDAVDQILNVDALGAFDRAAPFGPQINRLVDPVTIICNVFVLA